MVNNGFEEINNSKIK